MTEVFNSTADWRAKGFHLRTPPLIIISYDPAGDGSDNDALLMTAREEHQKGEPHDPDFAVSTKFRVLAGQRLPPNLEFPDKYARLLSLHRTMLKWQRAGRCAGHVFAIESNGVGWGLASSMRSTMEGRHVIPYTTVGNASEKTIVEKRISMPRLAALDNMRILLETHHLAIDKGAPGREALARELASFVWRRAGRPEALEGQKDDMVMALAGGLWVGSKVLPPILRHKVYRKRAARRVA